MDDELTPEQQFAAEDAERMVPRALMQGYTREEILADLARLDWSRPAAEALIDRAMEDLQRFYESPEARRQLVREARRQFVSGVLTAVVAVIVTIVTLFAAFAGMPAFIVAGGLFCGGVIQAARGWRRWRLYRRERLPFE